MTIFKEYFNYDGIGLAELIKLKEVSIEDVLETAIDSLSKNNSKLNFITTEMYDFARKSIKDIDLNNAPFTGVPMLLKDMDSSLAGYPMMQGSKYLKNTKQNFSNVLTDRFISSGALICAKSAAPEFGLMVTTEPSEFGPTKNPWDQTRTPGGSSGGSASAVASRSVPIAHASDGGGSIRIPAACCGLVGLKPTRGRISFAPSHGDKWGGFTHSGVVTRTIRDTAHMYDHIFGSEIGDPYKIDYVKGSLVSNLNLPEKNQKKQVVVADPVRVHVRQIFQRSIHRPLHHLLCLPLASRLPPSRPSGTVLAGRASPASSKGTSSRSPHSPCKRYSVPSLR